MKKEMTTIFVVAVVMGVGLCSVEAAIVNLTGPDGLSASAVFMLNNPTELQIILINNSTGVPAGFDSADQLLTGISFDFGMAVGATGTVVIGPGGRSINFDIDPQLGAGADVSGEWGYGNTGGTGMLTNIVSTNVAKVTTQFSGANLDGPLVLDGPQGGICTDPPLVSLGEQLGAVANSVVITLTLDTSLANLNFLENGVVAEFGSDVAFLVPEPATICLLGLGALSLLRRKRSA